jgi:hypothetical protein
VWVPPACTYVVSYEYRVYCTREMWRSLLVVSCSGLEPGVVCGLYMIPEAVSSTRGWGRRGRASSYMYVRGVRPLCLVQCDHVAMFISCSGAEMGLRDMEYEGMEPIH